MMLLEVEEQRSWRKPNGVKRLPWGLNGKESTYAGDSDSIPRSGRSPRGGNGNQSQYSCQKNPMDGGACWAVVHGIAKNQTQLSD